jgi:DNA-binding NtrC family response regulator
MTPLLWIEDDGALVRVLGPLIASFGYDVTVVGDGEGALASLPDHDGLVLLDLMLPPTGRAEDGLELLSEMLRRRPALKVIVLSGAGRRGVALQAVRLGAHDFLDKPVDPDVLRVVLERAVSRLALERTVGSLRAQLASGRPSVAMLGDAPIFQSAVDLADKVAPTPIPVLLLGENGTGKELMARRVHERSARRSGPLVVINCGALAPSLLESTLFGHVRGAFTGAHQDRNGVLVEANGGTLFLDEVGELEPATQVRLLRVIDNQEVLPVGADQTRKVDVRFVSATNRDLDAMVAEGSFRDDLFWRLNGVSIRVPPLRDRGDDVVLLAQHFATEAMAMVGRTVPLRIEGEVAQALRQHSWPGNLRELRHAMRRAAVMAGPGAELSVAHLGLRPNASGGSEEGSLAEAVAGLERRMVVNALAAEGGNRSRAAQRLGLSRQGLLNKIGRYDIEG